jgi:radical SAM protein with 4Fe4S-binding SPASM domain
MSKITFVGRTKTRIVSERILNKISPSILKKIFEYKNKKRIIETANEAKKDVACFFEKRELFSYVEIETVNRCNGTCSFFPANKNIGSRPFAKMSDDTFKKIIDELAELQFGGTIAYYSTNEPFMDNRIIDFIKYGASKVSNAKHIVFTNGTLLNKEKFQALIDSGLNYIRIDNYNDKLKLSPNVQKIYDEYKNKEFSLNCEIYYRLNDEILNTRGGSSPNGQKIKEPLNAPCYFPFEQLIIRADASVSLCCIDSLQKCTIGNVENQTLEEIWFGERHFGFLNSIRKNFRKDIEICRECDILTSKRDKIYKSISPQFLNRYL